MKIFPHSVNSTGGFTLVEVLVAMSIMGLVVAGAMSIFIMHQRMARATAIIIESSRDLHIGIDKIVYGNVEHPGLREAELASASLDQYGNNSWWLRFDASTGSNNWLRYQKNQGRIRRKGGMTEVVLEDVTDSWAVLTNGGMEFYIEIERTSQGVTRTNGATTFVEFRN